MKCEKKAHDHRIDFYAVPDEPSIWVMVAVDGEPVAESLLYVGPRMGRTVEEWTEAAFDVALSAVEEFMQRSGSDA